MAIRHIHPEELSDKRIDVHAHVGVSLKAFAAMEYPYAQTLEGLYYRQRTGGVDVNVVFPLGPDLFFDPHALLAGDAVPAAHPLSSVPYGIENQMLLREVFTFCPELSPRFLPFVSVDPGRKVDEQLELLEELDRDYPLYGIKIAPVLCQTPIARLLDRGAGFLDFARDRDLPFLFHTTVDPNESYSQASATLEVVEANPDLRFCLAHCIAFHRGYLDRAAALENCWVDTSALAIQVQLAASGSSLTATGSDRIDADFSDPNRVLRALVEAYPRTILWGTDSPAYAYICRRRQGEDTFEDFRLKARYEDEVAALESLPPSECQAISSHNTVRFLFGNKVTK